MVLSILSVLTISEVHRLVKVTDFYSYAWVNQTTECHKTIDNYFINLLHHRYIVPFFISLYMHVHNYTDTLCTLCQCYINILCLLVAMTL